VLVARWSLVRHLFVTILVLIVRSYCYNSVIACYLFVAERLLGSVRIAPHSSNIISLKSAYAKNSEATIEATIEALDEALMKHG
jgi:hypothetical protein